MRKRTIGIFAAIMVPSLAAMAAPADVVKTRIAGYRELGAAFKAVNDSLRGNEVQKVLLTQSAREIRNATRQQYGWFPAGSGPQAGVKPVPSPQSGQVR